MLYKYGKLTCSFGGFFYFSLVFFTVGAFLIKKIIIIPLAFVGYEMIIAKSALCTSVAIYDPISIARSWNYCLRNNSTF